MLILGIETTCDETGAAVVKDGVKVLSNVVASSANLQKKYGGVVPEVAAREQIKVITAVIDEALKKAFGSIRTKNSNQLEKPIDAIAISYGPGLIGSLLVGVETAKALALAWGKPLIPVNHLVGHIYANWLTPTVYGKWQIENSKYLETINHKPYTINFPVIALVVSGGHTDLVLMKNHGEFKLVGTTLDDSAGEAFDKVARVLGLSYPGGPEIERLASQISNVKFPFRLETRSKRAMSNFKLPRPMIKSDDFNFSFSGLKTSVVNLVNSSKFTHQSKPEVADEFQKAIVDVLVSKTIKASEKFNCNSIVLGGGVAANTLLRSQMTDNASRLDKKVFFPSKNLAVDNGAMIAAAAFFVKKKIDPLKLQANPGLHF